MESNVLRVINPHFATVRDNNVKQNLIRAVQLIGKAVQPSHIQREDFLFTRRSDLLKHMQVMFYLEVCNVWNFPGIVLIFIVQFIVILYYRTWLVFSYCVN